MAAATAVAAIPAVTTLLRAASQLDPSVASKVVDKAVELAGKVIDGAVLIFDIAAKAIVALFDLAIQGIMGILQLFIDAVIAIVHSAERTVLGLAGLLVPWASVTRSQPMLE